MKKILTVLIFVSALGACNKEPENLTSPCVGKSGSPCERTPLNQDLKTPVKV